MRFPEEATDPTLKYRSTMRLDVVVGRSAALASLLGRIRAAAHVGVLPVLLTGESGTGKSMLARVLHENSPRSAGPLVEVNCAAIPASLWEAEFFGSTKNAYTQAAARGGRFAAAEGGTLFLDEIGEIPLEHQAKLLRVLDQGCYERLGEDVTRKADVRIVAATNRSLEEAVAEGQFRADLLYRIDRFRAHVPSLAERREDVPELAAVLADRESKALDLPQIPIGPTAVSLLAAQNWPGNVRQLQSVIAQAVIEASMCGAPVIEPCHLRLPESPVGTKNPGPVVASPSPRLSDAVEEFKRCFVAGRLREQDWNITRTARSLQVSRTHLHALLGRLDIRREQG